jgi:thiol:disulfide interchange protein DsbA
MNCRDVDRILDEHALSRSSAAERADFAAHVAACRRCAAAVEAEELLRSESAAGPRPGLFDATARWVAGQAAPAGVSRIGRWQTVAGLGALAALALVVVFGLPGVGRDDAPSLAQIADIEPARSALPAATGDDFIEGRHFVRLAVQPAADDAVASTLSVIEFFMYRCNPCYQFEPRLAAWTARQDSDSITVTRVPIQWNPVAALHARAFYTAETLGVTDAVHTAFFAEIHERGNSLATEAELRAFFARQGVDPAAFDDVFHSLTVERRLREAARLADRFGISATPSMVVGDRYLVTPATAGSYDGLIGVVDWLAAESADRCGIPSPPESPRAGRCE